MSVPVTGNLNFSDEEKRCIALKQAAELKKIIGNLPGGDRMEKDIFFKGPKFILATDLDGTLVGNRFALANFNHFMIKNMNKFLLVYITGRTFSSTWQLISEENLLFPDIIITDMGTEIFLAPHFNREQIWEQKMSATWDAAKIRKAIKNVNGLLPQDVHPRFRLAFYTKKALFKETVLKVRLAVEKAKLPIEIVSCMEHIIDIVPAGAGKGYALNHIQELFAIKKENTFVCGDSGNDLSMFSKGFKGIVVGNALPELKEALKFKSKEIYFSRSKYASGIMEGLKKYGMV